MGWGSGVLSLLSEFTFAWDWEREGEAFLYHGRGYWLLSLSRGHEPLSGLWERKQFFLLPSTHSTWLPFLEGSVFKKGTW